MELTKIAQQVLRMREGSATLRVHTTPYHGQYSVGKHSYDAANLLLILHPTVRTKLEESEEGRLLLAVLWHDLHERWIGDLYGPVHWTFPDLKREHQRAADKLDHQLNVAQELTPESTSWLKAVDRIELWLWALDQEALGNRHTGRILERVHSWLAEYSDIPEICRRFIARFQWHRTHEDLEE